jgi:hypothetical protein
VKPYEEYIDGQQRVVTEILNPDSYAFYKDGKRATRVVTRPVLVEVVQRWDTYSTRWACEEILWDTATEAPHNPWYRRLFRRAPKVKLPPARLLP